MEAAPKNEFRAEKAYTETDIFYNSVLVGVDFMHANDGQLPREDNLVKLHDAGYLDIDPTDIFTVFNDIEDYCSFVSDSFLEDVKNSDQIKADMLSEIESQNGSLPKELFQKIETTQKSSRKKNSPRSIASGVVTNDVISDNEKVIRYARFKLVNYLLPNDATTMERKLSIALNFNLNTNKFSINSFSGEICKLDKGLTLADVEVAASELGIFDYIYPQIRKRYLKDLKKAA